MSLSLRMRGERVIETRLPAFVMGILNATPDSFWAGSRAESVEAGAERARALAGEGADILDIGGESTRPGAAYVGLDEELDRVIPLIRAIRKESDIPISVDTRKAAVLEAALDAGADICNDISALEDDPLMAALVARARIPVILMHKKGIPVSMQENPVYNDAVREVRDYLASRALFAEEAGIARDRIILDPGIGFGKRYADNLALIAHVGDISSLGYPVLMALSRKSCIGEMTGRGTADRLAGTLAGNLIAVQKGATFLRVHDVAAARDSLSVLRETGKSGNL